MRYFMPMIVLLSAGLTSIWGEEDPRQTLVILDVESGEYKVLAPQLHHGRQGSACFSPDERYVAFDAWPMDQNFNSTRLYVQDLEHPEEPPVDLGSGAMPSFSCTGEEIAFSMPSQGVWVMDSDGRSLLQVNAGAWHIVFSPLDKDVVAYGVHEGGPNIVLHNLHTDETRHVLPREISQKYQQILFNFQWSADGKRILFKAIRPDRSTALVIVGTSDDDPEWIDLGNLNVNSRSSIHPVTGHVYFAELQSGRKKSRIMSVDPDALRGEAPQQTELASQPQDSSNFSCTWSSDGKRLIMKRETWDDSNGDGQ